jgi:uncharacterized protein
VASSLLGIEAAGRRNRMILDLKGVFECEGFRQDFSYEMNIGEYEVLPGEFPFKEPVKISGFVRNKAGVVRLHVETESDYHTQCDRCCKPICEHIVLPFDNVLVRELSGSGGSEDIIAIKDQRLDIDELAYSNIILSLPMKHLCSELCKGICTTCGKNLNDGDCGCDIKV